VDEQKNHSSYHPDEAELEEAELVGKSGINAEPEGPEMGPEALNDRLLNSNDFREFLWISTLESFFDYG